MRPAFWGRSSTSLRGARAPQRVAVLLHDAGSLNKVTQTLLEMVRGGIESICRWT